MPDIDKNRIREIVREVLINELRMNPWTDRTTFEKNVQILDGRNIQTGKTTGTKIGTATDQKLGFFGETPVDQPATVGDPGGGATQDAEARSAIVAIIDRLQELGLIA